MRQFYLRSLIRGALRPELTQTLWGKGRLHQSIGT